MGDVVDFGVLPVVMLSRPPLAPDRTPIWTPELEERANQKATPSGSWFRIRFNDESEQEGLAIACGFQRRVRKWNLRGIVLPAMGGNHIASFHFIYNGESRDLPDGSQRMYWRLPVNERKVELFNTQISAVEALIAKADELDELVEEAFQEASARGRSFTKRLTGELAVGRVPSPDELINRILSPPSGNERNSANGIHTASGGNFKCSWTAWNRNKNSLVMSQKFLGAIRDGGENRLQIRIGIKRKWWGAIKKRAMIHMTPDLGYPVCWLIAILSADKEGETTGFMAVQARPDGDGTLLTFGEKETDKLVHALCVGRDLIFQLRDQNETIAKLPLHNDASFKSQYAELADL